MANLTRNLALFPALFFRRSPFLRFEPTLGYLPFFLTLCKLRGRAGIGAIVCCLVAQVEIEVGILQ
ncbi:MAG: hypothetical protein JO270_22850 [Acidobacteriaceae bacterium]|nr:hypothetical protein [Acidobacteriaceae bacterium]